MRRMMLAQGLGSVANLSLTRQEHKNVTGADTRQLIDRINDRVHQIALFLGLRSGRRRIAGGLGIRLYWPVAHLHRIQPARHLNHRWLTTFDLEMTCESFGIDRRRGDDQFQVGALR